jgi:hypothetical protein
MSVETEARRLAREGYGHEDLQVRLGISKRHARVIAFGKLLAARMEARDAERAREREKIGVLS